MKIFINDRIIRLISKKKEYRQSAFDHILDGTKEHLKTSLQGTVFIKNAGLVHVSQVIEISRRKDAGRWTSVTMQFEDLAPAKTFFKEQFNIVEAAGGLVLNDKGKKLMIFRLGKWDLPKGKLEKKEAAADGALREVEEECNIKVALAEKICHTWHTYVYKGKNVLKKSHWYEMQCLDDRKMKPQLEEDITDVRWMSDAEIDIALKNTFPSIHIVWERFNEKTIKSR